MGICSGVFYYCRSACQSQLPSISHHIIIKESSQKGRKLCIVYFTETESIIQQNLSHNSEQLIHQKQSCTSTNEIPLKLGEKYVGNLQNECELQQCLDRTFEQIRRFIISPRGIDRNRVLIEEPPLSLIPKKYLEDVFKLVVEKIGSLNGELKELQYSIFFEIPWKQVKTSHKIKIIKEVLKREPRYSLKSTGLDKKIVKEIDPNSQTFYRTAVLEE